MGVSSYSWIQAGVRRRANRFLRRLRGTDVPVDAIELIELEPGAFAAGFDGSSWGALAGCADYGLDAQRSFVLAGCPLLLVDGPASGMRVLWFGNGLPRLSEAEFIEHYTGHHGPLVASHAAQMGLNRYRQIPSGEADLRRALLAAGMGQGAAPAVFAELYLGRPANSLASLRRWPAALRAIADDEKQHIEFGRSMIMLAGNSPGEGPDHRRWRY